MHLSLYHLPPHPVLFWALLASDSSFSSKNHCNFSEVPSACSHFPSWEMVICRLGPLVHGDVHAPHSRCSWLCSPLPSTFCQSISVLFSRALNLCFQNSKRRRSCVSDTHSACPVPYCQGSNSSTQPHEWQLLLKLLQKRASKAQQDTWEMRTEKQGQKFGNWMCLILPVLSEANDLHYLGDQRALLALLSALV